MKAGFLGRFQPFHQGHKQVVEKYQEKFDELAIVIGSADKSRTEKNPLTVEERKEIIRECFPEIEIKHLEDTEKTEEGNREWIEKLERKLDIEVIISQNGLVKKLVEENTDFEIEEQELYDEDIYSGTEIRRRIKSGEEWRYLVPKRAREKIEEYSDLIKKSGTQYEFEPGWKKENAFHGTAEN